MRDSSEGLHALAREAYNLGFRIPCAALATAAEPCDAFAEAHAVAL